MSTRALDETVGSLYRKKGKPRLSENASSANLDRTFQGVQYAVKLGCKVFKAQYAMLVNVVGMLDDISHIQMALRRLEGQLG